MHDLILPAAGLATRMSGYPKFLLPANEKFETLLDLHIRKSHSVYNRVWVPLNPKFRDVTKNIPRPGNVEFFYIESRTMTETLHLAIERSEATRFSLLMPDTYLTHFENAVRSLISSRGLLHLALWKIRSNQKGKLGQVQVNDKNSVLDSVDKDELCSYPLAWGAMSFRRNFLQLTNTAQSHPGLAINSVIAAGYEVTSDIIAGDYYDCGTPREYFEMIRAT